MPDHRRVNKLDERHRPQHQDPGNANCDFQDGVHAQGVPMAGNEAREPQAPQTHPAHEGPEQYPDRDRGGPEHELQHLKPDDLVDQGRASAGHEQNQQERKRPLVCAACGPRRTLAAYDSRSGQ